VKRSKARKAQLVTPPAKSAPTTPGASPYASGFQVCMGANPILVPNPTTKVAKATWSQGLERLPAERVRSSTRRETPPPLARVA
jgi:hypothetical protein